MFLHPPTNFESHEIYFKKSAAHHASSFLDALLDIAELETETV